MRHTAALRCSGRVFTQQLFLALPAYTLQLHLFGGSLPDRHRGEDLLRLSERRHVGLEGSSHLLQSVNGEMLRVAQSVFVSLTMDAARGHPTGPAFVARGAETPLASQKAERGECRQPVKPLRGVRGQSKFSTLWADDNIGASSR